MDNLGQDGNRALKEIIEVISRKIKPGHEKDYDDWLRRYMILENKVPGYLGTTIIAPGGKTSSVRYVINRFSDKASMETWKSSEEALKLIGEADNFSTRHYRSATGLETWFAVPDFNAVVAPPKWKMAIIAFIAAYAISSVSRLILNQYLGSWPLLVNSVIYSAILVVSLTYLTMPVLSKLLRRWLYPATLYSQ